MAANGANGTVDLRGEFIRGWDNGRGVDSGRALAGWQDATSFLGRVTDWGMILMANHDGTTGYWDNPQSVSETDSFYAGARPYYRVRPRNVALLACMKL